MRGGEASCAIVEKEKDGAKAPLLPAAGAGAGTALLAGGAAAGGAAAARTGDAASSVAAAACRNASHVL